MLWYFSDEKNLCNDQVYNSQKHRWIATNNRDVTRVMKTKFPATVMVFGVVSSEGTSWHFTSLKSAWKSTPKCTWICWRVWWSPGIIRWPVADPGCGSRTRRRLTSPKRPSLGFWRSASSSRRRLFTRHAPSSGSVSRRWLRLKAATLNRCQLYYIIKLVELIFSINILK